MKTALSLAVVVLACGALGCVRTHITPSYGQSSSAAFAQQGRSSAKPAVAVSGLDSQEAAIISESYRKSLAPKTVQVKEEPVILVAPSTPGGYGAARPLAPSVPPK